MNTLELIDIDFVYPGSDKIILKNLNISFCEGSITAIVGQSGAGKSTLLYLISGFTTAGQGQLFWNGEPVSDLEEYRRTIVGTISQSYLLFPTRTVLENVSYPMLLKGIAKEEAERKAVELLQAVGIAEIHLKKLPEKLSGGEQQRVAIARCLAADSKVIVADEPTGNLDQVNTDQIFRIFQQLAHDQNKIIILVTHDQNLANRADFKFELKNGMVSAIG